MPIHYDRPTLDEICPGRDAVSDAVSEKPEPKRHWAIVADDDTALRHLLGDSLRQAGFKVTEVRNGIELMAAFSDPLKSSPDVIVTDINMPHCNGLSAIAAILKLVPDVNAIVITAFPDELTCKEAKRLGASAILSKPLDLRELQNLVKAYS